jgi:hypothetical protein
MQQVLLLPHISTILLTRHKDIDPYDRLVHTVRGFDRDGRRFECVLGHGHEPGIPYEPAFATAIGRRLLAGLRDVPATPSGGNSCSV